MNETCFLYSMDIAILTGADTELGRHLIKCLLRQGFRVHGIGNNFSQFTLSDKHFIAHPVDLTDLSAVTDTMGQILEGEKSLDLLIHIIDIAPSLAFERLAVGNLEAILKIGLLGPVLLTRLALPNLLQFGGHLINVISANKKGYPAGGVNALIEGGLREMNQAIFDSARDAGLRVSNLILRQNPEPDTETLPSNKQTGIDLEDLARSIEHLLNPGCTNVPAEIVLFPRYSTASGRVLPKAPLPVDPFVEVVLPPKAYCPPEPQKIPTQQKMEIKRVIPYSEEELEDQIAAAIEKFESESRPAESVQSRPTPESLESGSEKRKSPGRRKRSRSDSTNRSDKPEPAAADDQPTGAKSSAQKTLAKERTAKKAATGEIATKKVARKSAKKVAKKKSPRKQAVKKKAGESDA